MLSMCQTLTQILEELPSVITLRHLIWCLKKKRKTMKKLTLINYLVMQLWVKLNKNKIEKTQMMMIISQDWQILLHFQRLLHYKMELDNKMLKLPNLETSLKVLWRWIKSKKTQCGRWWSINTVNKNSKHAMTLLENTKMIDSVKLARKKFRLNQPKSLNN